MSFPPVFLPPPVADSVRGPYLPMYGVHISRREGGKGSMCAGLLKVESKAFCLIDSPPLTDCLQPLTLHCNVHADCFFFITCFNCMPPTLLRPCCIRFSTRSHPYFVHLPYARVNHYLHSFFPSTSTLWNSLPESVFPPSYNLNSFKRGVSRHLQP